MILLYAGAFSVTYLVMPGSIYRSGIILSILTLLYSSAINTVSSRIIVKECSKNFIVDYYDYYKHILGNKFGKVIFCIFFLNAFFITVCTLISMNELVSDFMKSFCNIGILTNPIYCFWAVILTLVTTPFIYKSSDESMSLISILTFFAILMSLIAVIVTFCQNGGIHMKGSINYFDFKGSVFSFDISYFSFIIQLNIFDLYEMFEGSHKTKFKKINKISFYTNFLIFIPALIMGI